METVLNYIKQPSTWRGLISLGVSYGLFHISPMAQDAVTQFVISTIAYGEAAKGTINVIRNERKK